MLFGLLLLGVGLVGVAGAHGRSTSAGAGFPAGPPAVDGRGAVRFVAARAVSADPARPAALCPLHADRPRASRSTRSRSRCRRWCSSTWRLPSRSAWTISPICSRARRRGQPVQSPAPALWVQNILFVVDGPDRRRLAFPAQLSALRCIRLGIVVPTSRQALVGLGVGLVMVPIVIAAEALATRLGLGASEGVERLTEQLIGPLTQIDSGHPDARAGRRAGRGNGVSRRAPAPVRPASSPRCSLPCCTASTGSASRRLRCFSWARVGGLADTGEHHHGDDYARGVQHVARADRVPGADAELLTGAQRGARRKTSRRAQLVATSCLPGRSTGACPKTERRPVCHGTLAPAGFRRQARRKWRA